MANDFDEKFDDRDIKTTLNAWRESAETQAERPEWFWARQRARITSSMNQPKVKRMPSLAWAGIAATVALGVALMVPGDKPRNPGQPDGAKAPQPIAQMTDPELLQQLERTMNSGVPEALQPASALAQEMEQAYSAESTSKTKERVQ